MSHGTAGRSTPATPQIVPPARACNACGFPGPHKLGDPVAPHGNSIRCGECAQHMGWAAKDPLKRRDRNSSHRSAWIKRHDGDLVCHWCLVRASETSAGFDIDHIQPREDGGLDEMRNTRPLCADCHTIRHALLSHQRHVRGKSARSAAA